MKSINPEMIVLAREIRGISQSELADLIQLTQGMLSKIEKGLNKPSEEIFTNICNILEFPMSFFEQTNNITASLEVKNSFVSFLKSNNGILDFYFIND